MLKSQENIHNKWRGCVCVCVSEYECVCRNLVRKGGKKICTNAIKFGKCAQNQYKPHTYTGEHVNTRNKYDTIQR